MKVIDSPSGGLRGKGSVRVIDDKRIAVVLEEKDGKTHNIEITYDPGVKFATVGDWQVQDVDDVFIQLTPDLEDIQYIRPRNGLFFVSFSRFGAEEGELPTLRYYPRGKPFQGAKWENPERYAFFGLYKIIGAGEYTGMEIMDMLTYEFEWDENLEEFLVVGSERKKWHEQLLTTLNVFGFDIQRDELHPGEFVDAGGPSAIQNILPEIEDILQQRNKLGQMFVKDGWVQPDSIKPGPYGHTPQSYAQMMAGIVSTSELESEAV